jgi:hypothetical protein
MKSHKKKGKSRGGVNHWRKEKKREKERRAAEEQEKVEINKTT